MGQDTLIEVSRRSVPIVKIDKILTSWHNSVLALKSDMGMNFFTYSHNLTCLDKKIDFIEFYIETPKTSAADEVCKAKFLTDEMKNIDYTEMLINPEFFPHNPQLVSEMANVVLAEWSPDNLFGHDSVIALLNNIGGVQIYAGNYNCWKCVVDLAAHLRENVKHYKSPKNFQELSDAVFSLNTTSICWSPALNPNGSCYFITALKTGCILIWNIESEMKSLSVEGKIDSGTNNILNMLFIPVSDGRYWLVCADAIGQIRVLDISLEEGEFELKNTHLLWEHKDRMFSNNLNYMIQQEKVVFICCKHRHLLIQLLDKNCKVISQYLENINDHQISDITVVKNEIYFTTFNVKIYKLDVNIVDSKLEVSYSPLELKETYPTYELHCVTFSVNKVMCALALIDRRVFHRKETFKVEVVFLSTEATLDSLIPTLVNNPSKKLTYYRDCVEVLRYKLIKASAMPRIDYKQLYSEGLSDPYKLKVYLVFLIINKSLLVTVDTNVEFPETSIENVKEKILLFHAKDVIQNIKNKYKQNGKLTDREKECLSGYRKYFDYYSKKHKESVEFDVDMAKLCEDRVFVCQCCDSEVSGFTCKDGHLNMLCMLSLTPIEDNYFVCKCCGSLARADIVDVVTPMCVFCDLYLLSVL